MARIDESIVHQMLLAQLNTLEGGVVVRDGREAAREDEEFGAGRYATLETFEVLASQMHRAGATGTDAAKGCDVAVVRAVVNCRVDIRRSGDAISATGSVAAISSLVAAVKAALDQGVRVAAGDGVHSLAFGRAMSQIEQARGKQRRLATGMVSVSGTVYRTTGTSVATF